MREQDHRWLGLPARCHERAGVGIRRADHPMLLSHEQFGVFVAGPLYAVLSVRETRRGRREVARGGWRDVAILAVRAKSCHRASSDRPARPSTSARGSVAMRYWDRPIQTISARSRASWLTTVQPTRSEQRTHPARTAFPDRVGRIELAQTPGGRRHPLGVRAYSALYQHPCFTRVLDHAARSPARPTPTYAPSTLPANRRRPREAGRVRPKAALEALRLGDWRSDSEEC